MFIILHLFLVKIAFNLFVSTHEILLQSDESDVSNRLYENQNVNIFKNFCPEKYTICHTSKHVFYWLYTRENTTGQLLNRSEPHMTETTTYDVNNPLKVVVHGWLGNTQEKEGLCTYHVNSYLKFGDYNVLCVDWKQYSMDLTYAAAKVRAKHIAKDIANVLNKITSNMTSGVENIHLIGHSMGAHIVGFTGKLLPNEIPRITGLDPARPLYENSNPEDRLNVTDAIFVDVIHTNGDKNGIFKSLGDIDFYPNGGKHQPSCGKKDKITGSCSHIKSYHYFAHSIWAKEDYLAFKCDSWKDYNENKCFDADSTYMGEHVNKYDTGTYYLEANVEDP